MADDVRLGADERGDELKIVGQGMSMRQRLQAGRPPLEQFLQIGQPDEGGLCDVADIDGFDDRPFQRHLLPLAASSRSHLRWCFQAQPPVTVPRVMARTVPFTQIAAYRWMIQTPMMTTAAVAWTTAAIRFCSTEKTSPNCDSHITSPLRNSARMPMVMSQK